MLSYVISVTLLTLAVIVLRAIFRNKMSSRLVYALWLAVLLRMVLPFDLISIDRVGVDYLGKIESAVGHEIVLSEGGKTEEKLPQIEGKPIVNTPVIENIASGNKEPVFNSGSVGEQTGEVQLGNSQTGEAYIPEISTDKSEIGEIVPSESGVTGSIHSEKEPAEIESTGKPSTVIPSVPQVDAGKPSVDLNEEISDSSQLTVTDDVTEKISVSVKDVLNTVWLAGTVITASVFAVSWAVFSVKLVRSRTLLTRSGKTCVYVSDRIASPCVCGIIPKIYVTPEARDSENLSTVILHEKVHVSHGDVIWNVLRIAAVSVFWYNPVIWAAAILSKRDAEFACDETTALKLEDKSKLEYARMIVDMTPAKKNYAVSFAGGPIKERVLKLTREHKNKIIVAAVAVIFVAVCVVAAFIGANDKNINDTQNNTDATGTELEASPAEDFEYSESTRYGIVITAYKGNDTTVVIPDKINGEKVTEIGKSGFEKNGTITKIVIPDSVIVINESAFAYCSKLEDVTLSKELVRIEKNAFSHCISLKEITIPPKIGTWEENTFEYTGLEKVIFEDGLGKIGIRAFKKTNLTEITLPSSVVTIGEGAFSDCKSLAKVTLSERLETLEAYAFAGSDALKEITLPKNVDFISYNVFNRCPALEKVTFLGDTPSYAVWPALDNTEAWNGIKYTVYYNKGAKGFTTPTWKGCPSAVIGEEPKPLEIPLYFKNLLEMPYNAVCEEYGDVTWYEAESNGTKRVCTFENLIGIYLVYSVSADEDVDEHAVPCEIVVDGRYKERVCGLMVGQMLEDAIVAFDWVDVGHSSDPSGRYATAAVGNYSFTVWMDYGIEFDYEGYWEIWASEFKEKPTGEIKSIRIGKLDIGYHGDFSITEATKENLEKLESYSKYDLSTSEYTFSFILTAEQDIENLSINRLIWNEELLVESEEVIEEVGNVKAGESILITTDSVEIIGYVGISYLDGDKTERYYPATSGKDGSAILVEIDDRLLPDTYREIPPDQRHVGRWNNNGYGLTILKVEDDSIAFSISQYKGFDYRAVAVLKDGEYVFGHGISPYTEYSDYYGNRDDSDKSGKLIFGEASVRVVAEGDFFLGNENGLNFTCTSDNVHGGSIGLSDSIYSRWIDYPDSVYSTKDNITDHLVAMGWFDPLGSMGNDRKNISAYCGEPNGVKLWGVELTPFDREYKTPYYTVVGNRGALSVAVRFAYDSEGDTCSVVDVYYADRFGNLLAGEELMSLTRGKTGLDAVLDPSDPALIGYFDKKGPSEKLDGERFEGEESYNDSISPEKLAAMDAFAKENAEIPEELPKIDENLFVGPSEQVSSRFESEFLPLTGLSDYRYNYFAEPTFLYPLVGIEAAREWYDKVIVPDRENYAVTDEMYTVSFVKYFEIPKEKFIEAQNEYRAKILPLLDSYGISTNNENYEEIPADIIYTFDKLIIDKYHWRNMSVISEKSAEVSAEHLEKAKTDPRYKFVCSLISRDAEALAELAMRGKHYEDDVKKAYADELAGISNVIFSGYYISDKTDNEGQFSFGFMVSYSEFDTLPPGRYEFELPDGMFDVTVSPTLRQGTKALNSVDDDEKFFIDNIIYSWWDSDFENTENPETSLILFYLYEKANGLEGRGGEAKLTMEELQMIARQVYYDSDFEINTWPFDLVKGEDGGEKYYKVRGMGGLVKRYDVLSRHENGDTVTYTVRYYSDHLQLGSGRVVQYVIERTDSPYGFRLRDVRELERSEYGVFTLGM